MNLIDKIYVVHYSPLKDRKEFMLKQFALFNITNYEFVEGISRHKIKDSIGYYYYSETKEKLTNAEIAITISHIDIYRDILKNNYKSCLIFEDDAVLCDKFDEHFKQYMECIPSDYDMAFINSGGDLHYKSIISDKIWYKTDITRTCCAYIITKRACEIVLDNIIPFTKAIDFALTYVIRDKSLNVYWCEPTIVADGSHMYGSSHYVHWIGKYMDMYNNGTL